MVSRKVSNRAQAITIRAIYQAGEPVEVGEFALQLRRRILKLRWMGYDAEAALVAERFQRLHLDSRGIISAIPETD